MLHFGARMKNMEPLQNLLKWIEVHNLCCDPSRTRDRYMFTAKNFILHNAGDELA